MKKFTLFLASAILSLGAMAQTQTKVYDVVDQLLTSEVLNAKTTSTMIAIKNLSATNHYYFVGNTGAMPYSKADWNTNGEAVFVWEPVTEGEAGSYYLKKLDGTYMQTSSPTNFGTKDNAAVFTTTNPTSKGTGSTKFSGDADSQAYIQGNDDANLVRFVTGSQWINVQNGDAGTPKYNTGEGGWTIHYVYAVEAREAEMCEVTYNFKYNGEVKATQTASVEKGTAYPDYNVALPYGVVAAEKPAGKVEANCAVDVALTVGELPFEVAADAKDITTWYYVIYHSNLKKYIEALADGKVEWEDDEAAANTEAHLWGFVGDRWGLKVVSKTGKAIVSTSGDAVLGEVANANAFKLVAPRVGDGVCLQYADGTYLNAQKPQGATLGLLKSWTDNDQGSAFLVDEYVAPEGPTGIEGVEAQEAAVTYDLAGRRVENPTKGIYIVNGVKVVIK